MIQSLLRPNGPQRHYTLMALSIVILVLIYLFAASTVDSKIVDQISVVAVKRQDLKQTIYSRGVIYPAEVATVASDISSDRAKIIWLHPEGGAVNKGDLIVRFDPQPFKDALENLEIEYNESLARFMDSEKAVELAEASYKAALTSAQTEFEIAKYKADELVKGQSKLETRKLKHTIRALEKALLLKNEELRDLNELLSLGHVSHREYQSVKNDVEGLEQDLSIANSAYQNYVAYTLPRIKKEAAILIDNATVMLEKTKNTHVLELSKLKARTAQNAKKLEIHAKQLASVRADLQQTEVRAPIAGVVLYKKTRMSGITRKFQVGDSVWQGQSILEIPNTNDLVMEVALREMDVARVKVGQEVNVTLDAFPGRRINGVVNRISMLPEADSQGVQRFKSVIQLNHEFTDLYSGMKGQGEITIAKAEGVLAVPLAAIHHDKNSGQPYVVLSDQEKSRKTVELGLLNSNLAEIVQGLTEFDSVLIR